MEIRYLYHSGFLVETEKHNLIFDYYLDKPRDGGLRQGVLRLSELSDKPVTVIVSHNHGDHFNPDIFLWRKERSDVNYIISDDVETGEMCLRVGSGERIGFEDGMCVRTLESTDEGVAFLVQVDKKTIYHAGDLNWWHWDGEPEEENREMGERYRRQIDLLSGMALDAAMVPVDPRLERTKLWGLDYLMRTANVRMAIPMHFGDSEEVFDQLQSDAICEEYRQRIAAPFARGELVRLR